MSLVSLDMKANPIPRDWWGSAGGWGVRKRGGRLTAWSRGLGWKREKGKEAKEKEKQTHHWNEMWDQERLYFHSLQVGEAGACANAEGRPQERRRTLEGEDGEQAREVGEAGHGKQFRGFASCVW